MSKETLNARQFHDLFTERELCELSVNQKMELYAEYYFQAKVNVITDEEIDRVFQLDKNVHPMHQSKVFNKRKGAKWFKNRLLNG